ncbi:MAG: glycine cleavage system protein R [Verrucomicrobiales bacterium]
MQSQLVLTFIGRDKPGLVEMVARLVAENGGNWLESKMSRLGGHFAGILRVSVPSDRKDALAKALEPLNQKGLKLLIEADTSSDAAKGELAELSLVGQDRPGIVKQITEALARHGVNVEEFESYCSSAPMSGENLFHAEAKVQIPHGVESQRLQEEFSKIAADLMMDIRFSKVA